jgi:O-methyltransferase
MERPIDKFPHVYNAAAGRTLLTHTGCELLWECARELGGITGLFAEVGCSRGGSTRIIASAAPHKPVHVFDTFEGLPSDQVLASDGYKGGMFAADEADVRAYLSDLPTVTIHRGLFQHSVQVFGDDARFAFVFVDVDLYRPCADALAYFWPRLTRGGAILFDDYGDPLCPGVKTAIGEFIAERRESLRLTTFGAQPFAALQKREDFRR